MVVAYSFSSEKGDVAVDEALLDSPFAVGPSDYHPFMTLRDFFDAVRDALLFGDGQALASRLSLDWQVPAAVQDLERIVVRYEKYGTLYQVCSVEVFAGARCLRLCATAALGGRAQQTLKEEMGHLQRLQEAAPAYLPRLFWSREVEIRKGEQREPVLVAFLEWFDDYHEWHFAAQPGSPSRAYVWDMKHGYRLASEGETREIVRQASKILSFYYDYATGSHVAPWHHGGGDFVVKTGPEGIDVKLITVRGYGPSAPIADPLRALLVFLLVTLTRMRLDKWEGMGESTWADRSILPAAVQGFVEGLKMKAAEGRNQVFDVHPFLGVLRTLSPEEIERALRAQLEEIRSQDESDYGVLLRRLRPHAREIREAIDSVLPAVFSS